MKAWTVLMIVCASAGLVRGQLSPEEAQRRLEERQRQRKATPVPVRAASVPAKPKKMVATLALKPGAPDAVRKWFDGLPTARAQYLTSMAFAVQEYEAQIRAVENTRLPRVAVGANAFGRSEMRPDESAARERSQKAKEMRRTLVVKKKALEAAKSDETLIPKGSIALSPGGYGFVDSVQVKQVVDDSNMIVELLNGRDAWLQGISTEGVVDDRRLTVPQLLLCSGTKKYETVLGGSRTVHVLEPLDYKPWVETVMEAR